MDGGGTTDICIARVELREIDGNDDLHEAMRRSGFRRVIEHEAGLSWLPDATYYRLGSEPAETVHGLSCSAARAVHRGPAGVVTAPSLLAAVCGDDLEAASREDFDEDLRIPSEAPLLRRGGRMNTADIDKLSELLTSTLEYTMPEEFRDASSAQKT